MVTAVVSQVGARAGWVASLREVSLAAIAGGLAGMLVGGLVGRVAMRISGAMSDPSMVGGAVTGNGNILGEITFAGTFALVIFSGLIPGIAAGLVYAAVRPWLRPLGRWAGLVFGLALLAALGPLLLEPFNVDFRKFGSAQLNVIMFALLFPLFGIAHHGLTEVAERRRGAAPAWSAMDFAGLAAAGLILILVVTASIGALLGPEPADLRPFSLVFWLVAGVAMRAAFARRRTLVDARDLSRRDRIISYAVLALPVLLGIEGTLFAARFLAR